MEEWQIEHITENLKHLVDLTVFNGLVKAELIARKVLSKADVDKLDAVERQDGDLEACRLYYQTLLTRKDAYKVLYEALTENCQSGAYTILIRVPPELFSKPLTYLGISANLQGFKDTIIEVHGNTLKLHEFFPDADYENVQQIFQNCLTELEIYDTFITKQRTFVLASNSIPPKPSYYVTRFLSNRIRIEKSIFQANWPDVFVFKNSITRYQLSKVARPQPTDISGSQLAKITCRFIHLEENEDWIELKKLAKVPIHLINYEADQDHYLLEDTSAAPDILRKIGSQKDRVYMTEEDFIQQQLSQNCTPSSVCICDSPGMGKTFLLANIARGVTKSCTGKIIVFIQLTSFSNDFFTTNPITNLKLETSLINVLSYVCPPQQNPELLLELVKAKLLSLEIFFDGFDELPINTVKWTKQVLLSISTFENIRIYITSRPHMRRGLETSLGVVAYDILPFNQQNQVDFLVWYWLNEKPDSDQLSLQSYATICLKFVNQSFNKNDKEIAGIPLLCQLIAEVYGNKKAFRSIKTACFQDVPLQISGMYRRFIANKISLVTNNKDEFDNIKLVCIWHALKLLYPTHGYHKTKLFQKVKHLLISSKILKAGVLQKQSNGALEFIHRTFAEYLVSEYLFIILNKLEMQKSEEMSTNVILDIYHEYSFVHSVIVVFFNSALSEINISKNLQITFANVIFSISNEEFTLVLCSCCQQNLLNIFTFLGEALTKCNNSWITECFTHKNSYELLSVCIKTSNSQMFHSCIQLLTEELKLDVAQINKFYENTTLLKLAADYANYTAVEYFVDRVPLKNQSLLYKCVYSWTEMEKRENILHLLLDKDPTLIHETPDILFISFDGTDVRLFKKLIEFGANLNAVNEDGDNCAMHAATYMSPSDYHELVQFLLMDCKAEYLFLENEKWSDPLQHIIEMVSLLPETLELLLNIPGTDISIKDRWKESLLFSAVEKDDMIELQQLVKLGVDYNVKDFRKRSLLHVAAEYGGVEMVSYLLSLKMDSNSRDEYDETPIHYASYHDKLSVVEVLVENGAYVQAKENDGRTALHLSAMIGSVTSTQIIKYLISKGAQVNDSDEFGNTPLHLCRAKEVQKLLVELGADIDDENNDGQTPAQKNPRFWESSN